ncbi:hypothetical protein [Lacrimispora saccharolytica]|nr:hypothetical protein [Lacrimispora saccharolytica]QRV20441.1 hypothetical protein I6K70_02520 [Lacrimispora saccharolytica]
MSDINKLKYEKTHSSRFMDQLPDVIEWLSEKGFRAQCSRYSRYKMHIDDFYKENNSLNDLESKFARLNAAVQECIEIVLIYEAFKTENSVGFNNRLKQIVNGHDFYDKTMKSDQARDFLYELTVAAYFKSLGYTIDFDRTTDVFAKRKDDVIFIECKRIKSLKALEENFRKAGKQLAESVTSGSYGLIFIDVYNCLSDKVRDYEYASVMEMNKEIKGIVGGFENENRNLIDRLLEQYSEHSLATCFTANRCLWLSDVTPQFYRAINVNVPISSSEQKDSKLMEILK